MQWTVRVCGALWLSAIATIVCADNNANEMKRLAGRFERTFTNAAGTRFRVVRESVADQSTVTTYDDAGKIVEAHSSTFRVHKQGPVQILSFSNLLVTEGRAKGHHEPVERSYIYRFDGDVFVEVWGILDGDDSPPRMFYWRRLREDDPG